MLNLTSCIAEALESRSDIVSLAEVIGEIRSGKADQVVYLLKNRMYWAYSPLLLILKQERAELYVMLISVSL